MIDEEGKYKRFEPDTVTCELMLQAMLAIQKIQSLEELKAARMAANVAEGVPGIVSRRDVPLMVFASVMRGIITDPRRFISALDMASENPGWWRVNFLHYFNPDWTVAELAAEANVSRQEVRSYLKTHVGDECYDRLPPRKNDFT